MPVPPQIEVASSVPARLRGLLGRKGYAGVLMLAPCNDVHTFGMSAPIDIAFAAPDGRILESHRGVAPNRRIRNRRAAVTLERFSAPGPWYLPGDAIQHPPREKGNDHDEEDLPHLQG